MTGLLVLLLVALWIFLCGLIAGFTVKRMAKDRWRLPCFAVMFVSLLILPLADELIGGFQFRTLCKRETTLHVAVKNPAGRLARYTADPVEAAIAGVAIPISHSHIAYHDTTTAELIASYDTFVAKGGLLVRTLGIVENNAPLTIHPSSCSGEGASTALPVRLKFNVIN